MGNKFTLPFTGIKVFALTLFLFVCAIGTVQAQNLCDAHFTMKFDSSTQAYHFTANTAAVNENFSWNFGDGTAPFTGNPANHHFSAPGTYSVCLTVTIPGMNGTMGCTNTWCDSVYIGTLPPTPVCCSNFTHTAGTALYSVVFTGCQNPAGTTYAWDFGDGSTGITTKNMIADHTYPGAGNWVACLTVTVTSNIGNILCTSHSCDTIKIGNPNPPPSCDAHFTFKIDFTTTNVTFNGAINPLGTIYTWNFGDGISGTGNSVNHHFVNPGVYSVCLTVEIPASGGTIGCKNTWCDSVFVGNVPPTPICCSKFTFTAGSTPYSVKFTACQNPVGTTYAWNFGDGSPGITTTNMMVDHTYPGAGNWLACLTATVSSNIGTILCTSHSCDTIKIGNPPPPPVCDAHFTFKVDTATNIVHFTGATNPTGTVYNWNFGDGISGTGNPTDHFYKNTGVYWVCLTVNVPGANTSSSCHTTWCDTIHIGNPPPPPPPPACNAHFSFKMDSVKCTAIFTAPANTINSTFVWSFGDGMSAKGNPVDHHYMKQGIYNVCLTVYVIGSNTGNVLCKNQFCDSIKIYCVPPPPPINCIVNFTFKVDSATNTVYFTSSTVPAGTVFNWNFGDSTFSKDPNPIHQYAKPGVYQVCLSVEVPVSSTNVFCRNTYCAKVAVGVPVTPPICTAKFRYYFDYVNPLTVKFQSSPNPGGTIFTWTFGDGDSSHDANPVHVFADTGLFNVCLTITSIAANPLSCSDNWCRKLYINAPIIHSPYTDQVMIYPNPVNGSTQVAISDADQPVMLQVFNSKGVMVIRKDNLNNGSYSLDMKNQQPGLYFYRVTKGSDIISTGKLVVQ